MKNATINATTFYNYKDEAFITLYLPFQKLVKFEFVMLKICLYRV